MSSPGRSLSVLVFAVNSWGHRRGVSLVLVRVGCARTRSLISVRDPGWLRVGDMMVAAPARIET